LLGIPGTETQERPARGSVACTDTPAESDATVLKLLARMDRTGVNMLVTM
jgi:hypothetical protein